MLRIHSRMLTLRLVPLFRVIMAFMKTVANLRRQAKCLLRYFSVLCGERKPTSNFLVTAAAVVATLLPSAAFAQVVISEVMYNPAGDNTKRQWVELYNAGSNPVTLTASTKGWRVVDSASHVLVDPTSTNNAGGRGSLTVAPGAYAIIASDPATFIEEYPGGSYSVIKSAISPSATQGTITLLDDVGNTVDTVSYSSDMGGSNDGTSLQKGGSSWLAATPTPGGGSLASAGNTGGDTSASDTGAATTTAQSANPGASSGDSAIMPPPPKVFADGGSDRTVIVGADTEFKARAYNQKKDLIEFSHFHWNFGDGSTADLPVVLHHFDYPGRYVVMLDIPEERDAVADQVIVTVESMKLVLSLMPDGGVAIENRAGRMLDLSRWIIRSQGRTFTIPERTFVLANTTLRISQRTLGFSSGSDIELQYPNGTFAIGIAPLLEPAPAPAAPPAPLASEPVYHAQVSTPTEDVASEAVPVPAESTATERPDTPATSTTDPRPTQVAAAGTIPVNSSNLWWFGAFGVATLAAGSLAVARRYGKREWDIIEESDRAV